MINAIQAKDMNHQLSGKSARPPSLRPGQTINVGRPNMLGEPTFYRLAIVFDDPSTCWMMLEHV